MDLALATVGIILTLAGVFYARRAAEASKESLRLQREDVNRRATSERPGLTASFEVEGGLRRVSFHHVRPAPYPYWKLNSVAAMNPTVAMLRQSANGLPVGPIVERLALADTLGKDQWGGPAPLQCRFFVAWNAGFADGKVARVRLELKRFNGEEWHQDFEVPPPT